MFGTTTPWITVVVVNIKNQIGNLTDIHYIWQRTSGIIDMWQEGSVEISSVGGDWQVTSHKC